LVGIQKLKGFRNAAGLPSGGANNTGTSLIKEIVNNSDIIKRRGELPLDGNKGRLTEYIIDPNNVKVLRKFILDPNL